MICRHDLYVVDSKLTLVKNELLNLRQNILKLRLYCKNCLAVCLFNGEPSLFSLEKPSLSEDRITMFIPLNYPLPKSLSEKDNEKISNDNDDGMVH